MSKERVALFVPTLDGGGAQRVMVTLANNFAQRGLLTDLVLVNSGGPYKQQVSEDVRIVDFSLSRAAKCLPSLIRYLRTERPNVMLGTLWRAKFLSVIARAMIASNTRLVLRQANVLKQSQRTRNTWKVSSLMELSAPIWYRFADLIVCNSETMKAELVQEFRLAEGAVKTIYNPIDLANVTTMRRQRPAPASPYIDDTPVILGAGRFSEQKDFATLIRAFARVQQVKKARLVLIGEGELALELKELAISLGIDEDIVMPGFVENPYPHMVAADVFVLSSRWEGFPNVLLEALACGTPVVSTDCPTGPDEMLEGGRHGMLVPVANVGAMVTAILETLADPPDPNRLVKRAKDFDVDTISEQYLEVLLN